MIKKFSFFVSAVFLLFLFGCKAKDIEIKISQKQIVESLNNNDVTVSFEAIFNGVGKLDEEQKDNLNKLEKIVEKYFKEIDFEVVKSDFGYEVEIEGELPIVGNLNIIPSIPWYVSVKADSDFEGWIRVQVQTGSEFEQFNNEIKKINILLSADAGQPIEFKLKSKNTPVIAPAVIIDNEEHLIFVGKLDGRNSLRFKGGVFDEIGAGFLIQPSKN